MRKRTGILAIGCLSLFICGVAYANNTEFSLKAFRNSLGEAVYYPVSENVDTEILSDKLGKQHTEKNRAPETAEIGDIFLGEEGYERVIAISDDGAFVTEQVSSDEINEK